MSRDEIKLKLIEILRRISYKKISNITEDMNVSDEFELDTLDAVEFIIDIEDEFDIMIFEDEEEKLLTVKDFIDCIISKIRTD